MRIILASTSPRRIELLKTTGLEFETLSPGSDEVVRRGESPRAMVARLAREKADATLSRAGTRPALIISADTTVVAPGGSKVLNKPVDAADAARMLKRLCGATHEVLTGYCILPFELPGLDPVTRVVSSKVTLRKLSSEQIRLYVATGEPMDKAGAYAAQGIGMTLVEKISGSYTNVVGLPMAQLLLDLEKSFGIRLFGARK